jgi:hypothetical protein
MGMTEQKTKRKEERGKRKVTTKGSRILGFTLIFNLFSFTCFSEVLA